MTQLVALVIYVLSESDGKEKGETMGNMVKFKNVKVGDKVRVNYGDFDNFITGIVVDIENSKQRKRLFINTGKSVVEVCYLYGNEKVEVLG